MNTAAGFTRQQYIIAIALSLAGTILFSAKGLFIKFAYEYQIDTISLLTLRMGIAVPIFLLIGYFSERFHQQRIGLAQLSAIAGFGVLGYYLASFLDMQGLHYISLSLERILLYLYPTFVLLLSAFVFKQGVSRRDIFGLALAYIGIIILFYEYIQIDMENVIMGSVLVMLSALAFAVFLIGSDRHIKLIGAVRFTAYAMSAAGFAVFMHYLSTGRDDLFTQASPVYFWATILAVFSTVIPSFLIAYGIRVLGAKKVSMLGVMGPVSTIVFGVVFLGEQLSLLQLAGMMIVMFAVTSIVISNKPDKDNQ